MPTFQPLTTFYLIKDVDIDVSYTNQYYFSSEYDQYNFFYQKVYKTVQEGTYQRKNSNMIDVPFQSDEIRECKYIMWQNANYSNKWYYAFVTLIDYVNPSVSRISYELDVYQTYLFDMEWKQSFIQRKHTTRYENGLPVVNMEDEGLDYGNTYVTLKRTNLVQIPDVSFCIMGFSEQLEGSSGTLGNSIHGIPTQLYYYMLPIWLNYPVKTFKLNNFSVTFPLINEFLNACVTNENLVGKMVSCVIVPFLTFGETTATMSGDVITINNQNIKYVNLPSRMGGYPIMRMNNSAKLEVAEVTDSSTVYGDFPHYEESKLLMYPYSFTELTTQRGDSFIIRNEQLVTRNGNITIGIFGNINFQNKMAFIVKNYLSDSQAYYMQQGIHDDSNASVPIIDDYTASYLQANSNSIAVARSNALLQQQSAVQVAENTATTQSQNAERTLHGNVISALGNTVNGIAGALTSVNPTSMLFGALGAGYKGITDMYSSEKAYQNSLASASTSLANSKISAQTDYQMSMATLDGKIQDAEQIPSTTRSMGGDYLFDIAYMCDGIYLLKKTIQPYYVDKLTKYFKLYGYKVNTLEVPSFHTRSSWNYLKIAIPNVEGNIPMNDLMKIRDIFIKGITLWHGDYIGDYSRSNNEI